MTVTVTAVAPSLVRESSQISGFALITLFSLNGLVLSLALVGARVRSGCCSHVGLIAALGLTQR
jgi:hypothetical protein